MLLPSYLLLLSSTAVAAESQFEGFAAPTEDRGEESKFDIAFGGMWSAGNTDSVTFNLSIACFSGGTPEEWLSTQRNLHNKQLNDVGVTPLLHISLRATKSTF